MRLLLLFILQLFSVSLFAFTFTVDNPTDTSATSGGSATVAGQSGDLRYCISNALPGDMINFNITGTAPYVITLNSNLIITSGILIDGSSQAGFSSLTNTPVISISGSTSGYGFILDPGASGISIQFIHFNNSHGTAISINGPSNVYIDGCYIGTDFTGDNYSATPPDTGIYISNGSSAFIGQIFPNTILSPAAIIVNSISSYSYIYFNNIGLNRDGLNPISGVKRTLIGIEIINGIGDVRNNIIGNCDIAAIVSLGDDNFLLSNTIGIDRNSNAAPNGRGIWVKSSNNTIHDNTIIHSTQIAGSSGIGMEISGVGLNNNSIQSNNYLCNEGGGIVFNNGSIGLSAPIFGAGPFVVYPDGSANLSGSGPSNVTIEFFRVDSVCSFPTQGNSLGSVTDDGSGIWSIPSNVGVFKAGTQVTAIARSSGNTSTFSAPVDLVAFDCKGVVKAIAGSDATTCSSLEFYLFGSVVNAADGVWSSSGTGYFYPSTSVYANSVNYNPSIEDIAAGSVKLTLTTDQAIGGCPDTSSSFTLSLPIPLAVTFGGSSNVYACPNASGVPLDGKLYNTTGGTWSTTGEGTFSASVNILNNTYIPAATELNPDGFAGFMLIADQPAGACPPINGNTQMHFSNTDPIADAGNDISTCINNPKVLLTVSSGSSSFNSITELWTNEGVPINDSIYDNDGTIHRYFEPTPADISSGAVTLIYKVSSPGCISAFDTLKINYVTPPVVFAGDSTAICGNAASFSLSKAMVSNNPGGTVQWSGFASGGPKLRKLGAAKEGNGNGINGFSGTFKNDTLINTLYYPSAGDRASLDGVILILTAQTADEVCSVSAHFPITFAEVADSVMAGSDTTRCQGDSLKVSGLVSAGFPYKWTSAGTGKFLPNNTTLNATYVPSPADLKKVAFNLILNAGASACIVKDEFLLILLPRPDVGVGFKQMLCPATEVTLNAAGTGIDQTGLWKVAKGSSGEISDSTNNVTKVINITAETNTYTWTITDNATSCSNSAEYVVTHCYYPPLKVFNALSPNDDGLGEFLEIENIGFYEGNKVSVFNRWGEMVFKVDNYDNTKEDVFKGKSNIGTVQELPNGSYYYVIDKGEAGGKPEKGFLVIQK